MSAIRKITFGIRPENKAFRIDSMWGLIVDSILDARGKDISETYFNQIAETSKQGVISLLNEKEGNILSIDRQNVTFTKNAYPDDRIDLDKTFLEFMKLWGVIQKVVKFNRIRRIGIVVEHRFDSLNNNKDLISKLTVFPIPTQAAAFNLHFESRAPKIGNELFDAKKSGFVNKIYDFYDSELDVAFPTEGKINANFDFQKYYEPPLTNKINDEIELHFYAFKKELANFEEQIESLGITK